MKNDLYQPEPFFEYLTPQNMIFHENHPSKSSAKPREKHDAKYFIRYEPYKPTKASNWWRNKIESRLKSHFSLKCGLFNSTNMGCNVVIKSKVKTFSISVS